MGRCPMTRILLGLLLASGLAWGDALILNDGRRLEGDLKPNGDDWLLTDAKGQTSQVAASDVKSIEVGKRTSDAETAKLKFAFIRRLAAAQADPAVVVARYDEFLVQYPASVQVPDARADLVIWRQRMDQRMTRLGNKWFSPTDLAAWDEQATAHLEQARGLVKDGRLQEAMQQVDPVLADDPANAGALYLKGVVLYRQDQLLPARKCFEGVAAAMGDHGPTLNNLAVILWKQKQEVAAMGLLDRAMVALPANQRIVDNVAEVLNDLPKEARNSPITKRLAARFAEQEPQVERALLASGWYRWGSTWVTKEQYAQLKEIEKQVRGQLDQLARDYDASESLIRQMTDDIASNQRTMNLIESNSIGRDPQGNIVRFPYPNSYYDLRNDIDRLTNRRRAEIERLDSLRQQADKVRAKLTVAPYNGILHIMEQDAMPLVLRSVGKANSPTSQAPAAPPTPPAPQP